METIDGEVRADVVIAGVGLLPHVGPLAEAGAAAENGVIVDEHCRTSLPGVYAVGDCARHPSIYAASGWARLESVQNAIDMAKCAAADILGEGRPYRAVPWFWSNQYDLRLQTAGLCDAGDAVVTRGDPASRRFSLVYLRGGRVAAVDAVNMAADFMAGKLLVERGVRAEPAELADTAVALKALLG